MLVILSSFGPLGSCTVTVSPLRWPMSAWPTGDSLETLGGLCRGSASVEPTMMYSRPESTATLEPTRTTSSLSSERSITCAERSFSSSWAMRDSSMACSFLASSYSEFSEMSPNSRASLIRSATSRRLTVERCSISAFRFWRPSGVRMTSRCIGAGQRSSAPGRRHPVGSGGLELAEAPHDRPLFGERPGALERVLDGMRLAQAGDVPGVGLAQPAGRTIRADVLLAAVDDPVELVEDLVARGVVVAV